MIIYIWGDEASKAVATANRIPLEHLKDKIKRMGGGDAWKVGGKKVKLSLL